MKFTGIMFPFLAAATLGIRAVLAESWVTPVGILQTRIQRLGAVAILWVITLVTCVAVTWGVYGFRYNPAPDPRVQFAFDRFAAGGPANRTVQWINHMHLMPQAWCAGFLILRQSIDAPVNYLFGQQNPNGWWYYFPVVFLVKTPLPLLLGLGIAGGLLMSGAVWRRRAAAIPISAWTWIALVTPAALYFIACMGSGLDHGVRHLLPVYPVLYIVLGIVVARLWSARRLAAVGAFGVLGVGLLISTTLAYPNFISYFNVVARPHRLWLLGDSNLDWGQDLPALRRWQREHPSERLYLCYFGSVDPSFYGIRYINLPSGYFLNSTAQLPDKPGVIAVSATKLQGLYVYPGVEDFYAALRARRPRAILNGSIYLFDFAPKVSGRSYSAPSRHE